MNQLPKCRLSVVVLLSSVLLSMNAAGVCAAAEESARPNIVVVLSDDLGYGDIGCFGSPEIKTPALDKFASEGVKLTSCYAAAPNCSPARTGLMTGRTPYRVGVHNWIPMLSPVHVRRQEITVATLLRQAGYATCHVGKWHMNGMFNMVGQPQPSDHGFDYWFSTQNNALPNHHNPENFVRNGVPVGPLEGYAADLVVEEAVSWLREKRDPSKPFFLYVCFHEPHEPIATDPKYAAMYPSDTPSKSAHHGNVTQLDHSFCRLMETLDDLNLRENTFVMFTSDNGPAITTRHPHGSSGPLRMHKGHLYEGGIRVPGIVRWPGQTQAGSVIDEPISGVDLLPTVCDIVNIPAPDDRRLDGQSVIPVLTGNDYKRTKPWYWQFNYARSKPKVAMRLGRWKVVADLTTPVPQSRNGLTQLDRDSVKKGEPTDFELYDLLSDVGETTNLANSEIEHLGRLSALLKDLHFDVCAESPVWPDWEFARYEGQRITYPEEPTFPVPPPNPPEGMVALFDGKTLDGWERNGGVATYRVEDGAIVGQTTEGSPNTFLCKGPFSDFDLQLEVLCDPRLNSGIQIRSHVYSEDTPQESQPKRVRPAGTVYGYQCEIAAHDVHQAGNFWDEARRTKWLDDISGRPGAPEAYKDHQWNHYRIVAQGNRIRSWVNGVPCADFRDDLDKSGFIGLQVHGIKAGTGPYEVRWRNIFIRELKPGEKVDD